MSVLTSLCFAGPSFEFYLPEIPTVKTKNVPLLFVCRCHVARCKLPASTDSNFNTTSAEQKPGDPKSKGPPSSKSAGDVQQVALAPSLSACMGPVGCFPPVNPKPQPASRNSRVTRIDCEIAISVRTIHTSLRSNRGRSKLGSGDRCFGPEDMRCDGDNEAVEL